MRSMRRDGSLSFVRHDEGDGAILCSMVTRWSLCCGHMPFMFPSIKISILNMSNLIHQRIKFLHTGTKWLILSQQGSYFLGEQRWVCIYILFINTKHFMLRSSVLTTLDRRPHLQQKPDSPNFVLIEHANTTDDTFHYLHRLSSFEDL